jgi:mono/diheme cytochrome c family protein
MKCLLKALLSGLAVMFLAQSALADSANGKKLHDEECVRCHGSDLYTREDRKVQSLDGLKHQVGVCISVVGVNWFDEETSDVVDYLNENFYKFK